jgi:hypothetical protein
VPFNAPTENSNLEYFTITHCFHPFYKRRFRLVEYSRNWGADKVSFFDDQQALSYLPARWTDRFPPDVFTVFSKGRAYFSTDALIELSAFIKTLKLARKDTADVK